MCVFIRLFGDGGGEWNNFNGVCICSASVTFFPAVFSSSRHLKDFFFLTFEESFFFFLNTGNEDIKENKNPLGLS